VHDVQAIAGKVAGLVALIGFVPYLISIVRRQTRPSRATWWIWSLVGSGLCASYFASGARDSIWVPLSYVIGPVVTAVASIKYGEGGWSRLDKICLAAAASSFVVWFASGSALVALLMNLGVDVAGAIPTIRKSYVDPASEDRVSWSLFFVANVLNLAALRSFSFSEAAYPLYLFLVTVTVVALLARKPLPRSVQPPAL